MSGNRNLIQREVAKAPFFVGVDLGGTSAKIGVVDDAGQTLAYLTIPTVVPDGAEAAAQRMGNAVIDAISSAKLKPSEVSRVGLGSPGTMDIPAGMLLQPVN